jgi:hypothetical protein
MNGPSFVDPLERLNASSASGTDIRASESAVTSSAAGPLCYDGFDAENRSNSVYLEDCRGYFKTLRRNLFKISN